jgi:chromosome segregation ATPase
MVQKIIIGALVIVFILLVVNIGTSLFFYKQYKENISYFDQQNWLTRVKLENIEKSVDGYKNTVENVNSQFASYAENLSSIEKKVGSGETERKDMTSRIEAIKSEMKEWQANYNTVVNELKDRTEILKTNVEQLAKGITEQVSLGKISVKGEPGAEATPAKAAPREEKKPLSSSAKASNFSPKQ